MPESPTLKHELLRKSIIKWHRVAMGKQADEGTGDCALCQQYYDYGCHGCPVAEYTGQADCEGSPHEKWSIEVVRKMRSQKKFHRFHSIRVGTKDHALRDAALALKAFLQKLLKDEEKRT